jgi:hypothetical protein
MPKMTHAQATFVRFDMLVPALVNQKFAGENLSDEARKELEADVRKSLELYVMKHAIDELSIEDSREIERQGTSWDKETLWNFVGSRFNSFGMFVNMQTNNFEKVYLTSKNISPKKMELAPITDSRPIDDSFVSHIPLESIVRNFGGGIPGTSRNFIDRPQPAPAPSPLPLVPLSKDITYKIGDRTYFVTGSLLPLVQKTRVQEIFDEFQKSARLIANTQMEAREEPLEKFRESWIRDFSRGIADLIMHTCITSLSDYDYNELERRMLTTNMTHEELWQYCDDHLPNLINDKLKEHTEWRLWVIADHVKHSGKLKY